MFEQLMKTKTLGIRITDELLTKFNARLAKNSQDKRKLVTKWIEKYVRGELD